MSADEVFIGKVIFFDPKFGYGFIGWSKNGVPQKDLFLHFSDINCDGFKTVKKDATVCFSLGTNHRGQPKAVNCSEIKEI